MNTRERLFFQYRSHLRRDRLPIATQSYKCVCPDVFSAQVLFFGVRFERPLANNDCCISVKAHFQIINFEIGERNVVRFVAFDVFFFVYDSSIEPNDREVVRFDLLCK